MGWCLFWEGSGERKKREGEGIRIGGRKEGWEGKEVRREGRSDEREKEKK